MTTQILSGKKIAILVESEFIPEEIAAYQQRFGELGATVHFMSRLWGGKSLCFVSDVDAVGKSLEYLEVKIDFQNVDINDYAAVIVSAGYTSVRLRYFEPPVGCPISPEQTRTAPAVQFFAQAMANPKIIKGAICHGLWLLTPIPELLYGRKVICHEVTLADITTEGKGKIGVLIEEHFDPFEFRAFNEYFPQQGYQVDYISHLWGNKQITFHSNSEDGVIKEHVTVTTEVNDINPADYKAIICIGAYAMDRLRYEEKVRKNQHSQAPAVVFIRKAMQEPNVKIGVICHGLWLLCAADILENRQVTCAHNILVDVENAGAEIIYENDLAADIVIDENLVTGRHPDLVNKFMETLVREIENQQRNLHAAMTV